MPAAAARPDRPHADPAEDRWYAALLARDPRFDGRFCVGVTSTGVYCRPVCRVRTPLRRNCRFFRHPALAEAAGFRPCLRCRPELAPGLSAVDSPKTLAAQAALLLESVAADGRELRLTEVAARLGVTDRHLRRIFAAAFGVSPGAFLQTRRLLQAKQLLVDTPQRVTDVAHACGYASVRRFNAAFQARYRLNPTQLRRGSVGPGGAGAGVDDEAVTVRLGWRPPYDVAGMRGFLAQRALPGVEVVEGEGDVLVHRRTLSVTHRDRSLCGWAEARLDACRHELELKVSASLVPALAGVIARYRQAFDLDADPESIDPVMQRLPVGSRPGLRLPGAVDGFETAVRVILGQQVTVAAARTLAQRLTQTLGEPVDTPWPALWRLFPGPQAIAAADPATLGSLGIVRQRVAALQALARALVEGRLELRPGAPLEPTLLALSALPGVGDWTVQLIAMRVLGWPDAFAPTDVGVLRALGTRDVAQVRAAAQAWRPWRAYAAMRLWQTLEEPR